MILNGSHRKNGSTAQILEQMRSALSDYPDVEVHLIHASDLRLRYCIGCAKCYQTGSCVFDDDLEKLSLEIEQADGLILGSPTYASNVSAQMKTVIDRGHFVIEQLLHGKYAVSVATYENYGGRDTTKILNRLLTYSGARLSGAMCVKHPFSAPLRPETEAAAQEMARRLYTDIQTRRAYFFQRMKHKIIFRVGILPFVQRKGSEKAGVLRRYRDLKLIP